MIWMKMTMSNTRIENGKCLECGAVNADLDGVCCVCGRNHREARAATDEELDRTAEAIARGIGQLKEFLAEHPDEDHQ